MELKKINANIKRIGTASAKLNELVHETAVGCVAHCQAHNDATPALRLVKALPKSHRRGLLVTWFARYSPIGMNLSTDKCGLNKVGSKMYNEYDIDAAKINPFYSMPEAEKEQIEYTLEETNKIVFGLASRLQKKLDEGHVPANDVESVTAQIVALKKVGQMQRVAKAA